MSTPAPAASRSVRLASLGRLAALGLIWGTSFVWIKLSLASFNPATITALRSALGAALLLGVLAATRTSLPRRSLWGHLLFLAAIGIAIPYSLFALAEQTIPSNLAGSVNSATPLFTLLFGFVWSRHRASRWQLLGLVTGFVGTTVMTRPWDAHAPVLGTLLAVAAAACYGVMYAHTARYVTGRAAPLSLATAQLILAAPCAALAVPALGPAVTTVTWQAAVALGILGLLGTGLAYLLNYRSIAEDGPLVASTVTYLIPVVAIVAGVVMLHEPLAPSTVLGMAITLSGIALTRRR